MTSNPVADTVSAFVDDGLDHVSINGDAAASMANDLSDEEFGLVPWVWDPFPKAGAEMSPRETVDFFMLGNTINFQFRDPATGDKYVCERDGEQYAGAMGMWAALHNAYDEDSDILTGEYLAALDRDAFDNLFPADDAVDIPMPDERYDILQEGGAVLTEEYDSGDGGRFSTLIDAADDRLYADGNGIIDRLVADFPSFDDAHTVDGQEVKFYKRAQLAVWMPLGNLQAMGEADVMPVTDQDKFTLAADYHMPNIGRYTGALDYDDELADAIDAGDPLVAGGKAETELRAAAVAYGLKLQDRLGITGAELDGALFNNYKDEAEDANPVHRTVTVEDPGIVTYGTTDY